MSGALRVLAAGPGATLQDGGRHGYLRFGVSGAGPMDALAFATANLAAESPRDAPAIEVALSGIELAAEDASVTVAIAGGAFKVALDGRALPPAALARLSPGRTLSIRPGQLGAWCYVAVAGHFDVPPALGSVSTHTRSGLGGLNGCALAAGDTLPLRAARALEPAIVALETPWLARADDPIRVVLGPQDDYFDPGQMAAFLAGPWIVSRQIDRMAYRLEGKALRHAKGFDIVSDGIAAGAIQVPGDGLPIVLMADRQPTGGYPKIANVIGADLGRLAQLRPGASLRFAAVTVADAVAARRQDEAVLGQPIMRRPLPGGESSPGFLLPQNLAGGVTTGRDEE